MRELTLKIMRMDLDLAPGYDARVLRMIPNITAELGPNVGPSKIGVADKPCKIMRLSA